MNVAPSLGCAGIRSAIAALPVAGGRIVLQAGTYQCDSLVTIARDNVELVGQGPATLIRLKAHANSPVLVVGRTSFAPVDTTRRVRIADLRIDGNKANQDYECRNGPCNDPLVYLRNNGITLRLVLDVIVERVSVVNARSGGLVTERGSRRLTVRDFTTSNNFFDGLAGYETENSIFTGLYIFDNAYAGISVDTRFNFNLISNTVITGSGREGVFMRDGRSNMFQGLQIRDSGRDGIFLAEGAGGPLTAANENMFAGIVVARSGGVGMSIPDASCTGNMLTASQLISNTGGCVYEPVPGLLQQTAVICR